MVAIARHETAIARDRDRAKIVAIAHTKKWRSRAIALGKKFFCGGKFFFVQEKKIFVGKKNQRAIHGGLRLTLALGYTGTQVHPECQSQGSPPMT